MSDLRWVQMTDEERDELLGDGGTGVVSFGAGGDEPPFSLPVSYGYNADAGEFYFRLSSPSNGGKGAVVDRPVTVVVHRDTDHGWRSVVATGRLEPLADEPYDSTATQGLWGVHIPVVDIFDRPREEVPFEDYRLDPDEVSGRKEAVADR
ncbi:pyridoxamine 5'-phosphate oxidase family protein [Halostella salina]|uniref:pyridoxamine 5'-phosphate oxidase family protein n=1 Tax=Halostella salina TaxID=1547897 RepID=UPI000EF7A80F|nr:pyridoxamine 5'-phosphate oxidase family protein [Halostella salina]